MGTHSRNSYPCQICERDGAPCRWCKFDQWKASLTPQQKEEWDSWMGFSLTRGIFYPRVWEDYEHDHFEGYHLVMHNDPDCERCGRFREVLKGFR